MSNQKLMAQHWIHWIVNLMAVAGVGALAMPFFRSQPESVHTFAVDLADWQRILLTFLVSVLFTHLLFKLFRPRICHLKYVCYHPPTWLAWLFGGFIVAGVDLAVGLSPTRYTASPSEWAGYGLGALVFVSLFRWLTTIGDECDKSTNDSQSGQSPSPIDWKAVKAWLQSDAPADDDFLGSHAIAKRLKRLLESGTRSIAIVGPFGAGKTSIVKWLVELVDANSEGTTPRLLISEHSCWNFESSASSIHAMLADAIGKVERLIDTFYVRSLPESYRQTFSSGGEWLDGVSKLLFGQRDPIDQFKRLSALLGNINTRLVFVVEDLDRNDSRTFDIQEVQAFLQQLKDFPNLSFVLTGGLASSKRIDFAKLCDHIEYLKSIDHRTAADLVQRVWEGCSDAAAFPHEPLAEPDRQHVWNKLSGLMVHDLEEMSLPQAVATLLSTPRSLRHVLGRTYTAWRELCGEIDWNHLLAVNVLRFAAPECFSFLIRRWDRLHAAPSSDARQFRQSVADDWNQTIQNVEWNPTAAKVVMKFLLPASESWLQENASGGSGGNARQGVQIEKYWRRAVNESIDTNDVRDQDVLRDLRKWIENPRVDSELVVQICKSSAYSDVWEDIAGQYMANQSDRILLLCQQVLTRICNEHGASSSSDSQGFVATWRFASRRVPSSPESRAWLEARIEEAAMVSIELVNGLWHYYGAPGGPFHVRSKDADLVRETEIRVLRERLVSAEALERILHPNYPHTLYQIVFDPGGHNPTSTGNIPAWTWLSPVLVESLRRGNACVAAGVASLVATRDSGLRREPNVVDLEVLNAFFPDNAVEVIDLMAGLAERIADPVQRRLVDGIVESARVAMASGESDDSGD